MAVPELDPRAAHAAIGKFRILDVREEDEFDGPLGRIEGAANVPLREVPQHAAALSALDRMLLVCRSGRRSRTACEILRERGIPDVTNLAGGMIAWNRAGLPIARTPCGSPRSLLESLTGWLAQVGGASWSDARGRLGGWLEQAGASASAPSHEALERVLERVEQSFRETGAPPDLEPTLAAYRRDLVALQE